MEKPDQQLEQLKKLLGHGDFVKTTDFIKAFGIVAKSLREVQARYKDDNTSTNNFLDKKIDTFITKYDKSVASIQTSIADATKFQKDFSKILTVLQKNVRAISIIEGEPGTPGKDAEITDELLEEIYDSILKKIPKYLTEEQARKIFQEEFKKHPPQIINQGGGGDWGAPFETQIKGGANVTVTKTGSGYIISAQSGGTTDNFVDNEIVTRASSTNYTLARTPVLGSEHLFGGGSRLTAGVDYTITLAAIVTTNDYGVGGLVADYRY